MKSLTQIEPRTAITNTASLVTLSQPGSYYLTGNLTIGTGDGIDITTNGVTLDLSGFTIASAAANATGNGILLGSGLRNIKIIDGIIQGGVTNNGSGVYGGGGFSFGIYYTGTTPQNVLVSGLSVSGCLDYGIYLHNDNSTVVEASTVRTVGGEGIVASTVENCSALDCGGDGIYGDQVSDGRGQSTGSSYGIFASATAQNCYGYSGGSSYGMYVTYTATGCYGYSASSIGLYALIANVCHGATGTGTALSTTHNVNSF
jgi:hypothetical protein